MRVKTVREVLNKLKVSAGVGHNRLRLQIGRSAVTVPIEIRLVQGQRFLYLSIPQSTGIYKIGEKGLEKLDDAQPAPEGLDDDLQRPLGGAPTVPADLAAQLKASVPPGYKLALKGGDPILVRERRKKGIDRK